MRNYFIYIVIHILMLLSSIGISAASVAFADITASFDTSLVLAGWVLSIYMLVSTAAAVLMGKISEILGKRNTFLVCITLFTLGSLLAALAPNIQLLIAFRFIQAIGGGGSTPVIVGITADLFPKSRQQAVGFSMSIANTGAIIGPSIGGWLVTSLGWRSIFWFNVPFGILIAMLIVFLLKNDQGQGRRIDFIGAGYFTGAVFALMIALSLIKQDNSLTGWLTTGALFLIGIILAMIFFRHEARTDEPLIDLDFLRLKQFAASNYYSFVLGACIFGFSSLVPLFALSIYQMTTIESSLVLSIRSIGTIIASIASSFLVTRWGYRRPLLAGSILMAFSIIFMGIESRYLHILNEGTQSMICLSLLCLVMGVGMGIASPASVNSCMDMAPQKAAAVTGVLNVFRQSGGAINIALATLILQIMGNMQSGFLIAFVATGILVLSAVPAVFVMPASMLRISRAST